MRKQQLRIATGGAVACIIWGACNATPDNTGTVSASVKLAGMALIATEAGTSYLSWDCASGWQWAWHRAGCSASRGMVIAMDAAQGMDEAVAVLAAPDGHTYRATANCMNSRLNSAMVTVIRRWRRE